MESKRGKSKKSRNIGVNNGMYGKSPWNKGTKGIMKPNLGSFKKGGIAPNKGKIIEKIRGEKNSRWKGGYKNTNHLNRRYRARKKRNGGSHTFADWETLKTQYNWTCPCCHKSEPEIKLTEDHIIPLSKGGSDNIENIQPLCHSCNSKKHTQVIRYN